MNTPSQSRCEPVIRTLLALADDLHRQQVRLGASAAEAQLQQEYDFAEREAGRLSEQEQHLRAAVAALSERRPSDGPGLLATKQDMEARSAERLMFGCTNCGHINDQRLDNAIPSSVAPHEGYAWVDIVFDGPPDHDAPHFVEVESPPGTSIRFGQWVERDDGLWALRFKEALAPASATQAQFGQEWTWSLDAPEVSGWRWIETWDERAMAFDVRRFHVGDTLAENVACWRYINPPTRGAAEGGGA